MEWQESRALYSKLNADRKCERAIQVPLTSALPTEVEDFFFLAQAAVVAAYGRVGYLLLIRGSTFRCGESLFDSNFLIICVYIASPI